jgi:hypothetical protein
MSEHEYDDGLVHAHFWASESSTGQQLRQEAAVTRYEPTTHAEDAADGYDDGLVHDHSWAHSH